MNRINIIILATVFILTQIIYAQETVFIKFKDTKSIKILKNEIETGLAQELSLNELGYHQEFTQVKPNYLINNIGFSRIFRFDFRNKNVKDRILRKIRSKFSVEYIQENQNYSIDNAPNDSLAAQQWALEKTGALQTFELIAQLGIQLNDILVAVIDTGIDDDHPDLSSKIYLNEGEIGIDEDGNDKRFNGIDDDNNGYIDDFKGFDFVDKSLNIDIPGDKDYKDWDNNPDDENGHGTSVAGIISAQANNGIGVAGFAPNVKILNLRAFDATGNGEDDDVASAIIYAVIAGAKVINMSFGDDKFSYLLHDAIKFAYDNGVILVGSSGNSSSELPHYPSSFSEVISVGASDENDFVGSFSNYGSTLDLVAPGVDIYTTIKDGEYGSISGTSAAAPFVSAASANILGFKDFGIQEVKQMLKSSADDINAPGWDLRSGAGRLNIFKIVTSFSPGIIKINKPLQDYATYEDSLQINVSVISPNFEFFTLQYGTGYNPDKWIDIPVDGSKQIFKKDLPSLDISSFADTVYTLRLIANLTNENNQEERVNFYVDRSPPKAYFVNGGEALLGKDVTIMSSVYSEEPASVKMFFRAGPTEDYNFVYMDQFNINTKTVYNSHFGFIPPESVNLNSEYEIYFEVTNLAGLSTIVDNNGKPFKFPVGERVYLQNYSQLNYSMPAARIYDAPVKLDTTQTGYLLINPNENSRLMQIFAAENDSLILIDSLEKRIPKAVGDFNGNGKIDILSLFLRNGYIDEQKSTGSTEFVTRFADSTGNFWPAGAMDLDDDGKTEVVAFADSSFAVYEIQNDLSLITEATFDLPEQNNAGYLGAPNIAVCDLNNDGKDELWFLTSKGVLHGYRINGQNSYEYYTSINLGLDGSKNVLTTGDYDGDGTDDVAVLLKSNKNNDIAPFYIMLVFNMNNEEFNLITSEAFIDAGSEISSGFTRKKYSLRLKNLNSDGKDELLVNVYPFFYVFRWEQDENKIIFYNENVNTTNIFIGDLNSNGAHEFGVSGLDKVSFFEIKFNDAPEIPEITDYFSIDSNKTYLEWKGNGDNFIVYKGLSDSTLSVLDTISQNFMIDSVKPGNFYYYAVQSVANGKKSMLSDLITIYSHAPAKIDSIYAKNPNSVFIRFSERMKSEISDVKSFLVDDKVSPNTIVAATQSGYILNFDEALNTGEHILSVKNLRDFYNSPVNSDSVKFYVTEEKGEQLFFVESFKLEEDKTLSLKFNLPVDKNSANNAQNYTFSPFNQIVEINEVGDDRVKLKTKHPLKSLGMEYSLKIENIYSSVETGNIKISSGAGSIIVLSSFENDLSQIYTYPNPVSVSKSGKITFAKLTKFAEINVFTIDGKKIKTLKENDGNGGLQWDLRDENGSTVNSGVYIYYVKAYDENGNLKESKLEKFVVVK